MSAILRLKIANSIVDNLSLSRLAGQQGGVQTDAASIKEAEKPATKKDL